MGLPKKQHTAQLFLLLFSATPRHPEYASVHQYSETGELKSFPWSAPTKTEVRCTFRTSLALQKRSWELWVFLIMSCWARTGSGSESTLAKIVTFVLSGPQASRVCQSCQCSRIGDKEVSSLSSPLKLEYWMDIPSLSLLRENLVFKHFYLLVLHWDNGGGAGRLWPMNVH